MIINKYLNKTSFIDFNVGNILGLNEITTTVRINNSLEGVSEYYCEFKLCRENLIDGYLVDIYCTLSLEFLRVECLTDYDVNYVKGNCKVYINDDCFSDISIDYIIQRTSNQDHIFLRVFDKFKPELLNTVKELIEKYNTKTYIRYVVNKKTGDDTVSIQKTYTELSPYMETENLEIFIIPIEVIKAKCIPSINKEDFLNELEQL